MKEGESRESTKLVEDEWQKVCRAGNGDAERGEAARRDEDMKESTLRYESYISSYLIAP